MNYIVKMRLNQVKLKHNFDPLLKKILNPSQLLQGPILLKEKKEERKKK